MEDILVLIVLLIFDTYFNIGTQETRNVNQNGETWVTQKTNVRRGLLRFPATNILLRQLSAYSSSGVLQEHEPPTSATLSVGLTIWPH